MIFLGLMIAAFGQLLALLLGAGGHGWIAPLYYSLILFVAYPTVLVRKANAESTSIKADIIILVAAVIIDMMLAITTYNEEGKYFLRTIRSGFPVFMIWLMIWALWQVQTIATIVQRTLRRKYGR